MTLSTATSAAGPTVRSDNLDRVGNFASQSSDNRDPNGRFALQDIARKLYPGRQVCTCLRHWIPGRDAEVWRNPETGKAYYRGLQTCKQIWLCPVCSARETEFIREKWKQLLGQTEKIWIPDDEGEMKPKVVARYPVGMATFTVGHRLGESAEVVLNRLTKAYKKFWSGRWSEALKKQFRMLGAIRGLDVIYSRKTGHHFHFHTVIVFDSNLPPSMVAELWATMRLNWVDCVEAVGGWASTDAFDFVMGDNEAVAYISKLGQLAGEAAKQWGQIGEVTKSPAKRGQDEDSLTPWELLEAYGRGDKQAGMIHREITAALKGKSVVRSSSGLMALLVGKPTDEAPPEDATPDEEPVVENEQLIIALTPVQWEVVRYLNKRGELLDMASTGDMAALAKWLSQQKLIRTNFDLNEGESDPVILSAEVTQMLYPYAVSSYQGGSKLSNVSPVLLDR